MEVITIESAAYKELLQVISLQMTLFLNLVEELKDTKNEKYLSVEEVCELTGFSKDWVYARKADIGYFSEGKDLKFWKPNVLKYMSQRSIEPKVSKVFKTLRRA